MKKAVALSLVFVCLLGVLVGCRSDELTSDDPTGYHSDELTSVSSHSAEKRYFEAVTESQELLDILADDIYRCWYDCIYKDMYREDIDYAIAYAFSKNMDNIETIESNDEAIKKLYNEVRNGDLKAELKAVMQAYNEYYTFVMDVSGSFETYSANKETVKKKLASALRNLEFEL